MSEIKIIEESNAKDLQRRFNENYSTGWKVIWIYITACTQGGHWHYMVIEKTTKTLDMGDK